MRKDWMLFGAVLVAVACSAGGGTEDAVTGAEVVAEVMADTAPGDIAPDVGPATWVYGVPLAPDSPWPKFRRDAAQTGRSPVKPTSQGGMMWSFPTAKGIFSTPVIAGDGTVYVGSGDRTFYALNPDGTVRWQEETGEIIDSAALLDDRGRVYWGSGDGVLRARDAATGEVVWDFHADDPEVNDAFINWFEGNVAMGPDGTLYVPNDNWFVYAIDRDSGTVKWTFETPDQTWALPAVDAASGRLYVANNNLLPLFGDNFFALDSTGESLWSGSFTGTIAASPLLTESGMLLFGGFDGFVHALDAADGSESWTVPARDHIYASMAELSDGTLVQAGADGTVYALAPADGKVLWTFDGLEPFRSSPAVDGDDNIYLGSGEGRLFVLRPDGTLRFSLQLIEGDRNDLNASPALGTDAIYIAGESGQVFSVPYDWCLRPEGEADSRCHTGGEQLPGEGAHLYYTTGFGAPLASPPEAINANQPLAFSLVVREAGDTVLALFDADSLTVDIAPAPPEGSWTHDISGDGRFLTVVPPASGMGTEGVTLTITGDYRVDPERSGLAMTGGVIGGSFSAAFPFQPQPGGLESMPLPYPDAGVPAGTWELSRLAAPLPTILPSYNQIGFDSLHFLIGLVEGDDEQGIAWVVGGRIDEAKGTVVPDPTSGSIFPLTVAHDHGLLSLSNEKSFALEAMNANLAFDSFVVRVRLDDDGDGAEPATVTVKAICSDIAMYGAFLQKLGLCNPQTDQLVVFGAALVNRYGDGLTGPPVDAGAPEFSIVADGLQVRFDEPELPVDAHRYALLVVDPASGLPVPIYYGLKTSVHGSYGGLLEEVRLKVKIADLPSPMRVYFMVDTYPAAQAELPPQQ